MDGEGDVVVVVTRDMNGWTSLSLLSDCSLLSRRSLKSCHDSCSAFQKAHLAPDSLTAGSFA